MISNIRSAAARGLGMAAMLAALAASTQAWAVTPRQLVEMADFDSPAPSPDGKRVAFRVMRASVERNTYDSSWYVQPLDGGTPPLRVADGGVPLRDSAGIPEPAAPVWSPDGRWLYYRACIDGRIDVWRAAADGSAVQRITGDDADVRRFELSGDGTQLHYGIGPARAQLAEAERAEYDGGILLDRSTPLGQPLFRSGYTGGRPATQRLGLMFNRVGLMDAVPTRWRAIALTTGEVRDLPASWQPAAPSTPADVAQRVADAWKLAPEHVDADGRADGRIAVLARTVAGTDTPRIQLGFLQDAKARTWVRCTAAACSAKAISDIQWRPDTDEVLFTVTPYEDGFAQSMHRWNVVTGKVVPVTASAGMLAGENRWGPGRCGITRTALACVTADAGQPPRLERVDLRDGARAVLFDPNARLAHDMAGIHAQVLRWADAGGRQYTGQFYPARRTDGRAPPLFVTYYRCMGFARGGSGDEWPLATLAEHGIATLCINAPAFPSDAAERYGLGLSAVASAVDRLAAQGRIDRHRIGMGGISFGSEVTMWTLIHSRLIAAASLASPTTSPLYYQLGSNIGDAFASLLRSNWQLGTPSETPAQWQQISPTLNLDRIAAPVLLQLPEQEYMHGLDYIVPMARDGMAEAYLYPDEPHNKFQPRHKLSVYARNLDWFRFWLLGEEDPAPAKAGQYARWRAMRPSAAAQQQR